MKNMKKRIFAVMAAAAMAVTGFTACSEENAADDGKLKIGVIQLVSHPSLDNCYAGIEKGLNESSYADKITIDLQNGNGESTNCDAIAKNMAAKNYDMIFAIATPAAQSAYGAVQNSDTPVIFCAVSDPVAAGLTVSLEAGTEKCIGTSDVLDFDAQLALIKALQPDVKKIGVLYTTTEANSVSHLKLFREKAEALGIEVIDQGVSTAADIPQAAASLASKVDCINNFTDNNVVNNLSVVLEKANAAGIPVYGSEVEQVKNGCIASMSIDYVALGEATAELGVKVLDGTSPADLAVGTISEATAVVNTEVMEKFAIALPAEYENAEKVTTNTAE